MDTDSFLTASIDKIIDEGVFSNSSKQETNNTTSGVLLPSKKREISHIHIRVQQRCAGKQNKNKMITIIEGLAVDLDIKKILNALKRTFQTNGTVCDTPEHGKIIQLNGDWRSQVKDFFVEYKVWNPPDSEIIIHGF